MLKVHGISGISGIVGITEHLFLASIRQFDEPESHPTQMLYSLEDCKHKPKNRAYP